MARRAQDFQTVRSEGGLLPADLLRRMLDPKSKLAGMSPEAYGLPPGERLNDVITQSWSRLRKHWADFRSSVGNLPAGDPATGLTNEKWNLPVLRELGFGLLPTTAGPEFAGRTYAISRFFGPVPVHLVGSGVSLDRRAAGVRGAAAANPHGLVQEFLNRSPGHLWAIVSNGLRFRVLRDNQALSRQTLLEFDLEAMFAGEVYSDFVLFWLLAHATRFAPREDDRADSCWLERWSKEAADQGTRVLGDLRGGVERALQILGEGFTGHPKNDGLREALRTGRLLPSEFHAQLLRVVYRFIFLFVAEDRLIEGESLLHPIDASERGRLSRDRYAAHYGATRLRELASQIKGSRHGDLWQQCQLLVPALSGDANSAALRESLALPVLGGFLWDASSTADLTGAVLTNFDLLESLRNLAFTRQGSGLRPVDYKNLGAEELGGVYETLLALTPQISADGERFTFAEFAGSERKTSGSYYTPAALVQSLLDSALDPVVEAAIKGKSVEEAEKAILSLKVCDPAVGSGHFLVGAARRLARHLSRVRAIRQGESEPSPLLYQHSLRDVIGRCLYGVDVSPMAAELCRVSLWLEALEPGKPLSFLDHHIRVGNSLIGATPELIAAGLPDEAYKPIEGDDKLACALLKQANKAERRAVGGLFEDEDAEIQDRLASAASRLSELPDDSPESVRAKEIAFRNHEQTQEYNQKRSLADLWCAAFVMRKYVSNSGNETKAIGITQRHVNDVAANRPLPADLANEVARLSGQYRFFHWHLAFPEVIASGNFDCVLGNPPWEKLQTEELQFFSSRNAQIAAMVGAKRKNAIRALATTDPELLREWQEQRRFDAGVIAFVRNSGGFGLTGVGKFNTFALFAELAYRLVSSNGRVGCIVPSGIATDDTTKLFFGALVDDNSLRSLFDFENRDEIFAGVHRSYKFCLLTFTGPGSATRVPMLFMFFAYDVGDLEDLEKQFVLSAADIALMNPNTRTCPIFRSKRDSELTKAIYRRNPVFMLEGGKNDYEPRVWRLLNTTDDSGDFIRENTNDDQLTIVPVIEAKTIHQFDHRYGTFSGTGEALEISEVSDREKADPDFITRARYYVSNQFFRSRLPLEFRERGWFATARNIARSTDERTCIASVFQRGASCEHTPYIEVRGGARASALLTAMFNSFVFDYIVRQKVGGTHLSYFIIYQLPVLAYAKFRQPCMWSLDESNEDWLLSRVLELTYTAWDLESFANACGSSGPPFLWDVDRRFIARCELDAAFFHLFLPAENGDWAPIPGESADDLAQLKMVFPTPSHAVGYIMDTFPIVRRKDEDRYNADYRTKRVICEIYNAMQDAIRTGVPYQTLLEPTPAAAMCRHPKKAIGILAFGSLIADPGPELAPNIKLRIKVLTPFNVEYGRYSGKTRGGAPTIVPHVSGAPVSAEILVLDRAVTLAEATDMLWRRERRREGTGENYVEEGFDNSVLVRMLGDSPYVDSLLHTDFNSGGKIPDPDARELAKHAIQSVRAAPAGKDGITYLIDNMAAGIVTPLTAGFAAEILKQTSTSSLEEAREVAKSNAEL